MRKRSAKFGMSPPLCSTTLDQRRLGYSQLFVCNGLTICYVIHAHVLFTRHDVQRLFPERYTFSEHFVSNHPQCISCELVLIEL
jgi:hypothetical protein